jgi:1,2-diacylglycerol 3-alpha-glucosyltransferase
MKIAIFTETFFPHTNGVLTAIINLSKGLADNGHKVYIITPKFKGGQEFIYPNITVHYIKGINAFIYEDIKLVSPISLRTLNFLKKEKIDIIHFMSPWTTGNKAIFISKILNVPLVGTFHTFIGDSENLKHVHLNYPFVKKHVWKYINSYYNKCDLVTCPSDFSKQELIRNKCKAPIKVISNGIEIPNTDIKNVNKIKKKYNCPLLLFVGRISYEKNLEHLIDCFKLIVDKKPNCKLLLIGDGPLDKFIKNKIISEKLDKNILQLGKMNHDKLIKEGYYKASDLFVSVSKTENCPLTVLEAQINGLIPVVYDAGGMNYLIKNNRNGILVPINDSKEFAKQVINLLGNKKKQEILKKNLKEDVKVHYIPNIIKQWEKEYSKLIRNNKK